MYILFIRERHAFNNTSTVFYVSEDKWHWLINKSVVNNTWFIVWVLCSITNAARENMTEFLREIQLELHMLISGNHLFSCHEILN